MRLLITMLLAALIALALADCSEDEPSVTPLPFSTPRVPQTPTPVPRATPPVPAVTPRSVVPGLDKGGLFGDGVKDLEKVDITGWLTYKNDKWGYSFQYPPGWELEESEAPPGSFPYHWVRVLNPFSERGANVPGVNCSGFECEGARPRTLNFGISVDKGQQSACAEPGQLVAVDQLNVSSRSAKRCAVIHPTGTPQVQLTFELRDGKALVVLLEKGRNAPPDGQAILETILDSLGIGP